MGKTIKKKRNKGKASALSNNILPQNILLIGERVEENKNIYISQQAYKDIYKFTQNKTTNESGGILVGSIIKEFNKTNIIISGFIEAKYSEGTPTTLKFSHKTWEYVHREMDKKYKEKKIVGWIHTHPNFGIFLSEYDKFIQQNFFNEDYQVAYVIDPIQNVEGFYFWINGNIEKCKGFYLYDKPGVKLTITKEEKVIEPTPKKFIGSVKNIFIVILCSAITFLIITQISTNNKIKNLQDQLQTTIENTKHSLASLQQQLTIQASEINNLKKLLKEDRSNAEPKSSSSEKEETSSIRNSNEES